MPLQLNCHPKKMGPGCRKWFVLCFSLFILNCISLFDLAAAVATITVLSASMASCSAEDASARMQRGLALLKYALSSLVQHLFEILFSVPLNFTIQLTWRQETQVSLYFLPTSHNNHLFSLALRTFQQINHWYSLIHFMRFGSTFLLGCTAALIMCQCTCKS